MNERILAVFVNHRVREMIVTILLAYNRAKSKRRKNALTSPFSGPELPKTRPLPWPWRPEGGLPPLAGGWGMGAGECSGEVTRGSFLGVGAACRGAAAGADWALLAIEPKLMLGLALCATGPPLAIWPVVPEALMTTEGFLPWLSDLEKSDVELPPWGAAVEADMFSAEPVLSSLPCCTGA